MLRKPIALAIILIFAGLAPATAIIGSCTRMPCCSHRSDATAFATDHTDCCTTIACYDTPSAKLTNAHVAAATPFTMTAVIGPAPSFRFAASRAMIDPSPPPTTQHRLAALSTLLI